MYDLIRVYYDEQTQRFKEKKSKRRYSYVSE